MQSRCHDSPPPWKGSYHCPCWRCKCDHTVNKLGLNLFGQVVSVTKGKVVCRAQNDATLDGLLTVIHSEENSDGMSTFQVPPPPLFSLSLDIESKREHLWPSITSRIMYCWKSWLLPVRWCDWVCKLLSWLLKFLHIRQF